MIAVSAMPRWILNHRPSVDVIRFHVSLLDLVDGVDAAAMAAEVAMPISWEQFCAATSPNQGGNGSCEGHAAAHALFIASAALGTPLPWFPSMDGLYKNALIIDRHLDGHPATYPLQDVGTVASSIFQGINLWGVQAMKARVQDPEDAAPRFSDCSAASIVRNPTFNEIEAESLNLFVGQYAVDGPTNASRLQAVNTALAKVPVQIGGFVDTNYMRWEPADGVYPGADPSDPQGGGHAQVIVGVRRNGAKYQYRVQNSWGPWCDNGRIWVDQNMILDADELTAITIRRAA